MNEQFNPLVQQVLDTVEEAVIGKRGVLEDVLCAFLAKGHVLLEDNPGVAKTLMAKSFAQVLGVQFKRVQFTPDLLPGDISGGSIYNRQSSEFEFRAGPLFSNVILADEINRASPKTQSALLEAMAEKQVTLEGETRQMSNPFWVIATQNPIEFESTFPLPEAQMDRFLIRLSVGYPSVELETQLLTDRVARQSENVELKPVLTPEQAVWMQEQIERVTIDETLKRYIVTLVQETRERSQISVGASPRGSLGLMALARARAAIKGRKYVVPDDIKHFVVNVLAHRIVLSPELWMSSDENRKQIEAIVEKVEVPVLDEHVEHS
jgi:MoxR-like ATPase